MKFDGLENATVIESKLFNGRKFDKNDPGIGYSAVSRAKRLLTEKYSLSDDFKATREFREIIEMLG